LTRGGAPQRARPDEDAPSGEAFDPWHRARHTPLFTRPALASCQSASRRPACAQRPNHRPHSSPVRHLAGGCTRERFEPDRHHGRDGDRPFKCSRTGPEACDEWLPEAASRKAGRARLCGPHHAIRPAKHWEPARRRPVLPKRTSCCRCLTSSVRYCCTCSSSLQSTLQRDEDLQISSSFGRKLGNYSPLGAR